MKNVTYLLGAGASYNALPVVTDMEKRVNGFIKFIKTIFNSWGKDEEIREFYQELFRPIDEEAAAYSTYDTFARFLDINGRDDDLRTLKLLLVLYFIFEQSCTAINSTFLSSVGIVDPSEVERCIRRVDPRYQDFLAALIDKSTLSLPINLNVLSWNYDYQFELAYTKFVSGDIQIAQEKLNVYPRANWRKDSDRSQIVRLNGSVLQNGFPRYGGIDFLDTEPRGTLYQLMKLIYESKNFETELCFGWESSDRWDYAHEIAEKTEVLIVIGYSFPVFNREIDKDILGRIRSLEEVYVVDKEEELEKVSLRLSNYLPENIAFENIRRVKDVEQFFIPAHHF